MFKNKINKLGTYKGKLKNQLDLCGQMFRIAKEEYALYIYTLIGFFLAATFLPFGAILFPNRIIGQIESQAAFSALLVSAIWMGVFYLVLRNMQNYCLKKGEYAQAKYYV